MTLKMYFRTICFQAQCEHIMRLWDRFSRPPAEQNFNLEMCSSFCYLLGS